MSLTKPAVRFLPQALDLVERALRSTRAAELGVEPSYSQLSLPHRDTPFLTLGESTEGEGLPTHVVKLLLLPVEHNLEGLWREVLEQEAAFIAADIEQETTLPEKLSVLGLPVTLDRTHPVRELRTLTGLRRTDLLEETGGRFQTVSFRYFVRPYIPWPPLAEASVSEAERDHQWELHCQRWRLPKALRISRRCRQHFLEQALFGGARRGNPANGEARGDRLFLVSHWRWRSKFL